MVKIRQNLVDPSRYWLKCPHSMTPAFLVIHNTANDASANNEIAYMRRNDDSTSFHYAVDDIEAVQGLPLDRNGWHAGDGANGRGNRNGIGIEICYSKSGGARFIAAEKNATKLAAKLLHVRGWGIDRVKKHQDFMNKYCPHRTLDMGWQRFLNMVQAELNALKAPPPPPAPKITYAAISKKSIELIRDTNLWNFNFTKWPDAKAVKGYKKGEKIDNIVAIATNALGAKYYMTGYSYNDGKIRSTNGFNINDAKDWQAPAPVEPPIVPPNKPDPIEPEPKPIPEPKPEPTPTPEPKPVDPKDEGLEIAKENNALLKKLLELVDWLVNKIKGVFK